jgi:hypothetical protein
MPLLAGNSKILSGKIVSDPMLGVRAYPRISGKIRIFHGNVQVSE